MLLHFFKVRDILFTEGSKWVTNGFAFHFHLQQSVEFNILFKGAKGK